MTVVQDPRKPLSCSADFEGGTLAFMPPELLIPSLFDVKNPTPTPEGDIYAFGLVIFQVRDKYYGRQPLAHTVQVLTGQTPFLRIPVTELGFSVYQGLRPKKPENLSAIGFSDSLWGLTQRCWDGNMHSRPKVTEVVAHLAKATVSWHGIMLPCVLAEGADRISEGPPPDSMEGCTFENLISSLVLPVQ